MSRMIQAGLLALLGMAAANGAAAMHEEDIDSRYGGHGG